MAANHLILLLALVALSSSPAAFAADPNQLQDFCVADNKSNIFVNGFVCKDPNLVTENDFLIRGLNQSGNTMNQLGSKVTPVFVQQLPGLNTLGVAGARIDYAAGGLIPPHTHPRASELLFVIKGTLYVGFVTSNPDNKLFTKVLYEGDAFVFPQGLIHFQFNNGETDAVALVSFGSQNPGLVVIGNSVFGAKPPISPYVLEKAFQLDQKTVELLQAKFWLTN
ncbi:putative germin-like protein 2-1 [Platanthera guangdongensis]|uniref:Germin-like protein n=1 Tax=Platanthera guangdongensis TaxID=2320717 RepID=A0ABR2MPB7_9ASPA